MKTLLSLIIALVVTTCSAQKFYQFQRFTTNLDGTLINGNTLTNVTAAPPTITYTNLISGLVYHNLTGRPQMTIQGVFLTEAVVSGAAEMSFYVDTANGTSFGQTNRVTRGTSVSTPSDQDILQLIGMIPIGSSYVITNTSRGAANSAILDNNQTTGVLITY